MDKCSPNHSIIVPIRIESSTQGGRTKSAVLMDLYSRGGKHRAKRGATIHKGLIF